MYIFPPHLVVLFTYTHMTWLYAGSDTTDLAIQVLLASTNLCLNPQLNVHSSFSLPSFQDAWRQWRRDREVAKWASPANPAASVPSSRVPTLWLGVRLRGRQRLARSAAQRSSRRRQRRPGIAPLPRSIRHLGTKPGSPRHRGERGRPAAPRHERTRSGSRRGGGTCAHPGTAVRPSQLGILQDLGIRHLLRAGLPGRDPCGHERACRQGEGRALWSCELAGHRIQPHPSSSAVRQDRSGLAERLQEVYGGRPRCAFWVCRGWVVFEVAGRVQNDGAAAASSPCNDGIGRESIASGWGKWYTRAA